MSISAISDLDGYSDVDLEEDTEQWNVNLNPQDFLFLIPTITAVALGALFIPHFSLGLAVGLANFSFTLISLTLLQTMGSISDSDEDSEYLEKLQRFPLYASLFGPILEEGIFRGIIQPLFSRAIQILVPAFAAAELGPFLVAEVISIVATSVIFGAAHALNSHADVNIQVVLTTFSGLTFGILASQIGLAASIAAHIVHNTAISFLIVLQKPNPVASL